MGVDLYLIPYDPNKTYSQTVLDLARVPDLWDKIKALEWWDVPLNFSCFCARERGYGIVNEDCYGEQLRYVLVKDLSLLYDVPGVYNVVENKAAWQYIRQLPDSYRVALFWH